MPDVPMLFDFLFTMQKHETVHLLFKKCFVYLALKYFQEPYAFSKISFEQFSY